MQKKGKNNSHTSKNSGQGKSMNKKGSDCPQKDDYSWPSRCKFCACKCRTLHTSVVPNLVVAVIMPPFCGHRPCLSAETDPRLSDSQEISLPVSQLLWHWQCHTVTGSEMEDAAGVPDVLQLDATGLACRLPPAAAAGNCRDFSGQQGGSGYWCAHPLS